MAIVKENTIHCSGSIISRNFVLTAAHCLFHQGEKMTKEQLAVLKLYFGTGDWSQYDPDNVWDTKTQVRTIEDAYVHPSYKRPAKYYDVGLIKITEKLRYSQEIQPICLPLKPVSDFDNRADRSFTLAAFGVTSSRLGGCSNVVDNTKLVTTILRIETNADCNYLIKDVINQLTNELPGNFTSSILCASSDISGHQNCPGDSGGPLINVRAGT